MRKQQTVPAGYGCLSEFYAAYETQRATVRPTECTNGEKCWVRDGPPAYEPRGYAGGCRGCKGTISVREAINADELR